MPVVPWNLGHQYDLGTSIDEQQCVTRPGLPCDWLHSPWHHVTAISQPSQDAYASQRCAEGSVPEAPSTEVIPNQVMPVGLYLHCTAYIKI
jgi:hypothetical protein